MATHWSYYTIILESANVIIVKFVIEITRIKYIEMRIGVHNKINITIIGNESTF